MALHDHPLLERSVVVTRLASLRDRVVHTVRRSRVLGPVLNGVDRVSGLFSSRGQSDSRSRTPAISGSRIVAFSGRIEERLSTAFGQSRLAGLLTVGQRFVEASWLYRWLTAEPDPEVVVIDLRETLTVGPWLSLFQHVLEWLLPAALSSVLFRGVRRVHTIVTDRPVQLGSLCLGFVGVVVLLAAGSGEPSVSLAVVGLVLAALAIVGSRITWTWAELRETRGYQAIVAAFEPPEPPESAVEQRADDSETQREEDTEGVDASDES